MSQSLSSDFQITELVESVSELPVAQGTALFSTLTQSLEECLWILTEYVLISRL